MAASGGLETLRFLLKCDGHLKQCIEDLAGVSAHDHLRRVEMMIHIRVLFRFVCLVCVCGSCVLTLPWQDEDEPVQNMSRLAKELSKSQTLTDLVLWFGRMLGPGFTPATSALPSRAMLLFHEYPGSNGNVGSGFKDAIKTVAAIGSLCNLSLLCAVQPKGFHMHIFVSAHRQHTHNTRTHAEQTHTETTRAAVGSSWASVTSRKSG